MTDPQPQTSTLAGAVRIVRMHGFCQAGAADPGHDGDGFPGRRGRRLAVPDPLYCNQGANGVDSLNEKIEQALAFFHLPSDDLEVLCC
jgi:hypothetical protein